MSLTFSTALLAKSKETFDIQQSDSSKMSLAKFAGGTAAKAGVFALAGIEKLGGMIGSKISSNDKWAGMAAEASSNMSSAADSMNKPFVPTTTKGGWFSKPKTIEGPTVASYIKAGRDSVAAKAAEAKDFAQKNKKTIAGGVALAAAAVMLYYFGPSLSSSTAETVKETVKDTAKKGAETAAKATPSIVNTVPTAATDLSSKAVKVLPPNDAYPIGTSTTPPALDTHLPEVEMPQCPLTQNLAVTNTSIDPLQFAHITGFTRTGTIPESSPTLDDTAVGSIFTKGEGVSAQLLSLGSQMMAKLSSMASAAKAAISTSTAPVKLSDSRELVPFVAAPESSTGMPTAAKIGGGALFGTFLALMACCGCGRKPARGIDPIGIVNLPARDQYGLTADQRRGVEADLLKGVKPHAIAAKLDGISQADIKEIREGVIQGLNGKKSYNAIAQQFGLRRDMIAHIMNKKA